MSVGVVLQQCPSQPFPCYTPHSLTRLLNGQHEAHSLCWLHPVCLYRVWLDGIVVRTLDLRSTGREFDSRLPRFQMQPWASCSLTQVPQSPSSINLEPVQAGKVTVGLASHWPCITDTVVYPLTGSTAYDREMNTPPVLHWDPAHFTFSFVNVGAAHWAML